MVWQQIFDSYLKAIFLCLHNKPVCDFQDTGLVILSQIKYFGCYHPPAASPFVSHHYYIYLCIIVMKRFKMNK